jgi:ABC-type branched-subunit amino acid transport system substrate-binding protein
MKMRQAILAIAAFSAALGMSATRADEPTKIKVGILLPLTGTFAAVAETQKQSVVGPSVRYGGPERARA